MHSLGATYAQLGQLDRAMALYRESIATHHEVGNRRGEAEGLDCLAKLLHDTGDEPAAEEAWRQALVIFEELGSSHVPQVRCRLAAMRGHEDLP